MIWKKLAIILFWLCLWQLAAIYTNNSILLVGPIQAGQSFLENIARPDFWNIVFHSFGRIGLGFLTALLTGIILGALAYRFKLIEVFLEPLVTVIKSVPVVSFVVLLLIWFGSANLSFFISFLVVLPNIYVNTIAGLRNTDRNLIQMAQVFHIGGLNRFFYIYRPALMPYLMSALKISLGMSWKSGVAAEIIGLPQYSLGERLYMSKVYLDTAGLFSWTLIIILLSFAFEKAVLYLVKRFDKWEPVPVSGKKARDKYDREGIQSDKGNIYLKNICKSYNEQNVIDNFSYTFEQGGHYCLMAPSGAGKTTLLKLISGIESPDSGIIEGRPEHVGMVFQEDRLCERYNVITNIMLTTTDSGSLDTGKKADDIMKIRKEALCLLPESCLNKPVNELSGGMKRRCAILRAMLSCSEIVIMDEPFNGLDEENRRRAALYILERLNGRTLIITTHRDEDIELFNKLCPDIRKEMLVFSKRL
ncbi:MAG: ATP-binding cassette domain-containing protein [Lachnospiraceae bacterium]|nr:ATP-binding cassette domain-containing protein [Lachnospiraceae bacterium]